ncbi:MAG TPA: hypothetical protein VLB75_03535 [Steroidobacteraceae bacterium]|nr:hypothetical protein [Steroidobacteraceae bacterium]
MNALTRLLIVSLIVAVTARVGAADPSPGETTVLGPFTGVGAKLHPKNVAPIPIAYYGTDLGWTYEHRGQLHFLFGDTAATEKGDPIEPSSKGVYDDSFGTIDLAEWPDPTRITPGNIPPIYLGQNAGTAETSAINPGQAMESFKTPLGGFSNGKDQFALLYAAKPQGCRVDQDCSNGLTCDTGLGFIGERYDTDKGQTVGCVDGTQACNADTMNDAAGKPVAGSGFCIDPTSSAWADTEVGRISAIGVTNLLGVRSTEDPRRYEHIRRWITNKFSNVTPRTVKDFVPARGSGRAHQDYRIADGGSNQRVFLWGRPGFIGVGARGRTLGLYFAYADLPAAPGFAWQVHYYTGTDAKGIPQFSPNEREAAAVDLDASRDGVQPEERYDVVDQISVAWVEPLKKWVMLYGGGMINLPGPILTRCGVLEFFTRSECAEVVIGNGAIRMRTADDPWGPWSPPQDVLVAGDPGKPELQYGPGGVLRHPDCKGPTCAPHTNWEGVNPREYGFLYGVNIIEQWTRPAAGGGVDILWNASSWDPYRVILLRTRINR